MKQQIKKYIHKEEEEEEEEEEEQQQQQMENLVTGFERLSTARGQAV